MKKNHLSALIIVILGFALAVFIALPKNPKEKLDKSISVKISHKKSPALEFRASLSPEKNQEKKPEKTTENLTDFIAQSYIENFLKMNPEGIQTVNGKNGVGLPPLDLSPENLQNFFSAGFNAKRFQGKDLKIISDDSKQNQIAYLQTIYTILKNYSEEFYPGINSAIEDFFENNETEKLDRIIKGAPSLIASLATIEVPINFVQAHLELLNLWEKKLVVYEAIRNNSSDPLKGYLALNQAIELWQEDIDLQIELNRLYKNLETNS